MTEQSAICTVPAWRDTKYALAVCRMFLEDVDIERMKPQIHVRAQAVRDAVRRALVEL